MKNNLLTIALIAFCFFETHGQQTPVFSDYNYNTILINPAHAGFYEDADVTISNRGNLNAVEGSPQSLSITANIPFRSKKVGLGAGFISDQIGVTTSNLFFASYAYKVIFNDDYNQRKAWNYNPTVFSFGITGGILQFDENLVSLGILNDPNFQNNVNTTVPTVGAGFLYNRNSIYFGASATNLLGNTFTTEENINIESSYYVHGGYRFFLTKFQEVLITPNTLIRYVAGAPTQVDLNIVANYRNIIEAGTGYRTNASVNFFVGFYAFQNFRVLFNYTANTTQTPINNTLGVALSYRLGTGFNF